jgi:hypothetical protein
VVRASDPVVVAHRPSVGSSHGEGEAASVRAVAVRARVVAVRVRAAAVRVRAVAASVLGVAVSVPGVAWVRAGVAAVRRPRLVGVAVSAAEGVRA